LPGSLTTDFLLQCVTALSLGAFISASLVISGQKWARSFASVTTYCMLPLIGLVITQVISGNLALSLGMVGALSIVRFRHPVKSPLELTIYFLLLTVGITTGLYPWKAVVLTVLSMLTVYLYGLYVSRKKGFNSFVPLISPDEQSQQYVLEIRAQSPSDKIRSMPNLIFAHESATNDACMYKLLFERKQDLDRGLASIRSTIDLDSITVSSY